MSRYILLGSYNNHSRNNIEVLYGSYKLVEVKKARNAIRKLSELNAFGYDDELNKEQMKAIENVCELGVDLYDEMTGFNEEIKIDRIYKVKEVMDFNKGIIDKLSNRLHWGKLARGRLSQRLLWMALTILWKFRG